MRPAWVIGLLVFFSSVNGALAESLSFEVCAESSTWVRPSPEVQAKIWNDNRYKDFAKDSYAWTHNFLFIDDPQSASVTGTFSNLSGMWTAQSSWMDACRIRQSRNGLEWIEIWSLLHRVQEVRRDTNTYTVIVEPVVNGFQIIHVRRQNPSVVLRFVTPEGKELERWDESAPPRPSNNNGSSSPVRR
jgi:hypothetical protein